MIGRITRFVLVALVLLSIAATAMADYGIIPPLP